MAEETRSDGPGRWLSERWLQVLIAALVGAAVGFALAYRRRSRAADAEGQGENDAAVSPDSTEGKPPAAERLDTMGRRLLLLGIDALEAHVRQHFASLRLQAEDGPAAEPSQETSDP